MQLLLYFVHNSIEYFPNIIFPAIPPTLFVPLTVEFEQYECHKKKFDDESELAEFPIYPV